MPTLVEFVPRFEDWLSAASKPLSPAIEKHKIPMAKNYLFGWPEIASCLDQKNDDAFQKRIKGLHEKHPSPIAFGGRGTPPKVERSNLIKWWNSLEAIWHELDQRSTNRKESVADSYEHGRDGTVIPGIAGHEKQRRIPKN
jgi:hypothetical protein